MMKMMMFVSNDNDVDKYDQMPHEGDKIILLFIDDLNQLDEMDEKMNGRRDKSSSLFYRTFRDTMQIESEREKKKYEHSCETRNGELRVCVSGMIKPFTGRVNHIHFLLLHHQ